jgi:two-component system sensor histidine kinase MprB
VALDKIVEGAVEKAGRRSRDLRFDARLEPTLVCGSPEQIGRAVANLLDNAVKWSPAGGEVDVTLRDGVLSVRDSGPGFDAKDLPHLFDRFYRAENARGLPGSGLGLAIVRQTAEAHGGYARAENDPEGGARLVVSFGAAVPPAPTASGPSRDRDGDGRAAGGAGRDVDRDRRARAL